MYNKWIAAEFTCPTSTILHDPALGMILQFLFFHLGRYCRLLSINTKNIKSCIMHKTFGIILNSICWCLSRVVFAKVILEFRSDVFPMNDYMFVSIISRMGMEYSKGMEQLMQYDTLWKTILCQIQILLAKRIMSSTNHSWTSLVWIWGNQYKILFWRCSFSTKKNNTYR